MVISSIYFLSKLQPLVLPLTLDKRLFLVLSTESSGSTKSARSTTQLNRIYCLPFYCEYWALCKSADIPKPCLMSDCLFYLLKPFSEYTFVRVYVTDFSVTSVHKESHDYNAYIFIYEIWRNSKIFSTFHRWKCVILNQISHKWKWHKYSFNFSSLCRES